MQFTQSKRSRRYSLTASTIAIMAMVMTVFVSPATAAELGGGSVSFEGRASLPEFPCVPPPSLRCDGVFAGIITSSALKGVDGTNPWTVTATSEPGETDIRANFRYHEDNCELGEAEGSGTFEVGDSAGDVVLGTYGVGLTARTVHDIEGSFTFSWTRIGNTATITARVTVDLTFADGGPSPIRVITNHRGDGEAGFAPLIDAGNAAAFLAACSGGAPIPIEAEVAGTLSIEGSGQL